MTRFDFWKAKISTAVSVAFFAAAIFPATAFSGPKQVPLKISLEIQEQVGYKLACPSQFGSTITGKGKSSHLGNVSLATMDCITPMEDHFTFKGQFTLIAANGDKLIGDYSGSFVPVGAGPTYELANAELKITGGTGRFSRANGTAELNGSQDTTTGKGKMEANGTVSY
ncbi:MAG: hypothetical protein NTAFB09_04920 [Nitrosospira sp.]